MDIAIVTGSASFIGEALVKELTNRKYYVIQCYHKKEPKEWAHKKLQVDLFDYENTYYKLEHHLNCLPVKAEKAKFFHLASLGSSTDDFERLGAKKIFTKMTEMDTNAYQLSKELVCDFIYASSYGALNPRHDCAAEGYDLAKRCMNFTLLMTEDTSRTVNLPSVIGPNMDIEKSRLIPNIVKGTFKKDSNYDGKKEHPLIYIDDAIKMLLGDSEADTNIVYQELDIIVKEVEYWRLDGKTSFVYDKLEEIISKTVNGIKRRLK